MTATREAFVGAISAEDLARAMYEDMRDGYRQEHRRPPPWDVIRRSPSTIWDPPGRGNYSTYGSIAEQWLHHARRILGRLA